MLRAARYPHTQKSIFTLARTKRAFLLTGEFGLQLLLSRGKFLTGENKSQYAFALWNDLQVINTTIYLPVATVVSYSQTKGARRHVERLCRM